MQLSIRFTDLSAEQQKFLEEYVKENGGTTSPVKDGLILKKTGSIGVLKAALRAFSNIKHDWIELK